MAVWPCWCSDVFLHRLPASAKWYDTRDFVFIEFCVADSRDVKVNFDQTKCIFRWVCLMLALGKDLKLYLTINFVVKCFAGSSPLHFFFQKLSSNSFWMSVQINTTCLRYARLQCLSCVILGGELPGDSAYLLLIKLTVHSCPLFFQIKHNITTLHIEVCSNCLHI